MSSKTLEKLKRDNSLEDFEFLDCDGDLNVDFSKSPIHEAAEKLTSGVSTAISTLSLIVEENGFTVSVPVQAMAATAVGALTGSLIGGPSGLAIGLLTSAVIAYSTSPKRSSNSKPAPAKSTVREVFSQMTFHQKKELIKELLGCLKQSNVRSLIYEIIKNESIRNLAIEVMSNYLKQKVGVCLTKSAK